MEMEFVGIFVLILLSIVLSTIISGASYIVSIKQPDGEKYQYMSVGLIRLVHQGFHFR